MTLEEQQDAARRAVNLVPSLLSSLANDHVLVALIFVPCDQISGIVTYHTVGRFREAGFSISKTNAHDVVGPDFEVRVRPLTVRGGGKALTRLYLPFKEPTFSDRQLETWNDWSLLTSQCQGVNTFKGFFY